MNSAVSAASNMAVFIPFTAVDLLGFRSGEFKQRAPGFQRAASLATAGKLGIRVCG
jgi:hypothetical protein